jgi:hypothetical protein
MPDGMARWRKGVAQMTETYINRPVCWNAERGVVAGTATGSRGKVLLCITLASGREIKAQINHVEFTDIPIDKIFTKPTNRVYFERGDAAMLASCNRLNRQINGRR